MSVTEEMITAYADGELDGEALAEVEAAIAADPALARKVQAHRALKDQLGTHFAPLLDLPVPSRLTELLQPGDAEASPQEGNVASFAAARQRRGLAPTVRRWAPIAGPALAASLVLALWQPWQGTPAPEGYAGTQLAASLDNQLVAEQGAEAETRILLSFEGENGRFCRAYRGDRAGGIACRDATGWKIEREFGLGNAQRTEFRQAGSEAELLAAAQEMAAGEALDADAEAEARKAGWR